MTTEAINDFKETELASGYTISNYQEDEADQNRSAIATFIKNRFTERYITPLIREDVDQKHGFCTMAICCLMIESLESFRQGWERTDQKKQGQKAFCLFFNREPAFASLRDRAVDFYRSVRCGILHQGETTNGWRILRKGSLFDGQNTLNATEFHTQLHHSLETYCKELEQSDWESDIWVNLRKKMAAVVSNCTRKAMYFAYGSNMKIERLKERAPSAKTISTAKLKIKRMVFNKRSTDGSGKANLIDDPNAETWGVIFEIDPNDLLALDKIEKGYTRQTLKVWLCDECWVWADTYISTELTDNPASDSYKKSVIEGAKIHNLPKPYQEYLQQLPARSCDPE